LKSAGLLSHQKLKERVYGRENSDHSTIPELIFIAGTRIALSAGLGLLIADKPIHMGGWELLAVGGMTTVPLVTDVLDKPELAERV
jgi:hypothetical protein